MRCSVGAHAAPMKALSLQFNELPLQVACSMCAPGLMVFCPKDGVTSLPGWGVALSAGNQQLLPPRSSV